MTGGDHLRGGSWFWLMLNKGGGMTLDIGDADIEDIGDIEDTLKPMA